MKRLILLTCLLAFVSVAEAWAKRPGRSFMSSLPNSSPTIASRANCVVSELPKGV